MPNPVAPAASPAPVAEQNRTAERTMAERDSAMIAKFAGEANAALAVELEGEPDVAEAPPEKPARGPGGKFVAAEKPKADAAETPAEEPPAEKVESTEEPPEADADEPPAAAGAFVKARRLISEALAGATPDLAKIDEACKLALGKSFDELPITAKHWHSLRAQTRAERARAQQAQAQLEERAQRIVATYEPLVKAKQALDAGDLPEFIRLSTGQDVNAFQKRLLGKFFGDAKQGPEDSRLTALQKRLDDYERRDREREEQAQRATAESQQKRAIEEHVAGLSKTLRADPRFAKAAAKPVFIDRVFALQREHYDAQTGQTITPQEAAELVWDELYGGLVAVDEPDHSDQPATAETAEDRPRTAVKQPRKSGRINHSAPSEATGPRRFKSEQEMLQAFVREAEADIARESSGTG